VSNHKTIGVLRKHTYRFLRTLSYLPNDMWEAVFAKSDELRPPRSKTFIYGYDPEFQKIGQEFVQYFVDLAGLQRDEEVLDIGCGIGRVAIPLAAWLSPQGSYHGFDLVAEGVRWCRQHITPKHPNFHFERADIYNATYNPGGRFRAAEFRFPYADASFDFAWTKSVFTHMFAEDVEHYLLETARVLKAGGRCLHTFFILNDESQRLIHAGKSMFDFRFHLGDSVTVSAAEPEKAIAFDESLVRAMYQRAGLQLVEPIHWGAWSGRREFLSGQEIIVAVKP
jgi:SAM-dependent methyltransferase